MFIKNLTSPSGPAPVPTLNGMVAHPPTNSTHSSSRTSKTQPSPNVPEVTGQNDPTGVPYPTGEMAPGKGKKHRNKSGLPAGVVTSPIEGQSEPISFLGSDWPDTFVAPRAKRSSILGSVGRFSLELGKETADAFPLLGPLKSILGGISVAVQHIDVRFSDLTSCGLCLTILS